MKYILSPAPQGTDEWKLARLGKATGSRAADIVATIKSGEAAARRDYRVQLVAERLTGMPAEYTYVSKEMEWGTEQEPYARMVYESMAGEIIEEVGFAYLPNIMAGCSVDGFTSDGGIIEIKCPKSATHVGYISGSRTPSEYIPQIKHNLYVTGADFCRFISFDPRMPENLQLFVVTIRRDEIDIADYELKLLKFLTEVDKLEGDLRKIAV